MSLLPGSRLGPYHILRPLGAGGMGEVYLARDPRLEREVAIKVLPAAFAEDPERLARFEVEARAASALNHPNILIVYDVGVAAGTPYLVTEFLEGQTLRGHLTAGSLPLRKTVDFAVQLARGLAAAHLRGTTHRDLKPENLFITADGRLKILDFGLAKLSQPPLGSASAMAAAPTEAIVTTPGIVLGTIGYMAPEQLRGQAVDHRADLFAFGAVLFEMLSGRRAFQRDSAGDTMSAILRDEPPAIATGGQPVSAALERIALHCLEKDPAARFQSASDLAFQVEALTASSGIASTVAVLSPGPDTRRARALLAAFGLVAAAATTGWLVGRYRTEISPTPPPELRLLTSSGDDWRPSVFQDSQLIAFVSDRDGVPKIWLKQLLTGDEVPLTAGDDDHPRFSPDGAAVLFVRTVGPATSLWRVPVVGGEPRRIVVDAGPGDWSPDGKRIAFSRPQQAGDQLLTVAADGSDVRLISEFSGRWLDGPSWSPDGRRIAATTRNESTTAPEIAVIDATDGSLLQLAPMRQLDVHGLAWNGNDELMYVQPERLSQANTSAPSHVVLHPLSRGAPRIVLSLPRAADRLAVLGPGKLILDLDASKQTLREISPSGSVHAAGRLTGGSLTDRQPAYSPDGHTLVFTSSREGNFDIWQLSTETGSLRRLTDHPADDWDPAFTADGKQLLWSSNRGGHFEIWVAAADGTDTRQLTDDGFDAENPTATPDGAWVVYSSLGSAHPGLWKIRLNGDEATRLVEGEAVHPEVSPDGRYALYFSSSPNEGWTLHVARVGDGAVTRFAVGGLGRGRARWLPAGLQIAFLGDDQAGRSGIYVQDFDPDRDTLATRRPLTGFASDLEIESFGISPDGGRLTLAEVEWGAGLLLADGVSGILGRQPAGR